MSEQDNDTQLSQSEKPSKGESEFAGTETTRQSSEAESTSSSGRQFDSSGQATKSPAEEKDEVKWLAALAYLPLICLIPLFLSREDEFIQKHAKQGFVLFMVELVAMLLKIDAIWNLIIFICIATAIVGALGILLKGEIRIPLLADFAEKLNI